MFEYEELPYVDDPVEALKPTCAADSRRPEQVQVYSKTAGRYA